MKYVFVLAAFILGFQGCSDNTCCQNEVDLIQSKIEKLDNNTTNITPVAIIIGLASQTTVCEAVSASAAQSYDSDGSVTSYVWSVDGQFVSSEISPTAFLPCEADEAMYNVCLKVMDDKNASSVVTCQNVSVVTSISPVELGEETLSFLIPNPVYIDDEFIFSACDLTFDGKEIVAYHWEVTKHFSDGATATHTHEGCEKSLHVESKEFESVDVTLTITFSDGTSSTTTQSYIINDDLEISEVL